MSGSWDVHHAPMAVVTDLGRLRGPRFGLPVNGALDQYSARAANILVGNHEADPLIEVTAFDAEFSPSVDVVVAVTGAEVELRVGGLERPSWEPVTVRAGERLQLQEITAGMRCYVAVHGSFDVPYLLGSCAPDSGVGFSAMLSPSTGVPLRSRGPAPVSDFWGISLFNLQALRPRVEEGAPVDVIDGPDSEEFKGTAQRLFAQPYTVSERSNHVGLRMHGGALPARISTEEKISRGVPIGAVEVPPGDELLVLHRGRGVTAGYPVLGVVTSTSLDTLGQVRPGQEIEFRPVEIAQARQDARAWRAELDALRQRTATAFDSLGLGEQYRHVDHRRSLTRATG